MLNTRCTRLGEKLWDMCRASGALELFLKPTQGLRAWARLCRPRKRGLVSRLLMRLVRFSLTTMEISGIVFTMTYSSGQVARKLGIGISTLSKYITLGKVPAPQSVSTGGITVYLWTAADIEHVRELLPKIANGRKTRWQRQREKEKKGTKPRAAALPKKRETKKRK